MSPLQDAEDLTEDASLRGARVAEHRMEPQFHRPAARVVLCPLHAGGPPLARSMLLELHLREGCAVAGLALYGVATAGIGDGGIRSAVTGTGAISVRAVDISSRGAKPAQVQLRHFTTREANKSCFAAMQKDEGGGMCESCAKAAERKGYLKRGTLGARSLIVKGVGRRHPRGIVEFPVVGRIAAGRPIEAIECEAGSVIVSEGRGPAFALKIEGNSMVEAGILDGDCVVVRKQETANNGDIVVALIEGEARLKRFYRESGGVRLEPANRRLAPIQVKEGDFRIQGKAVAVLRAL